MHTIRLCLLTHRGINPNKIQPQPPALTCVLANNYNHTLLKPIPIKRYYRYGTNHANQSHPLDQI